MNYFPIFKGFDWAVEKLCKNTEALAVLFLLGLGEYTIFLLTFYGIISGYMLIVSAIIVLGLHSIITNSAIKLYKNEHAPMSSFFDIRFSMIYTLFFVYLIIDIPSLLNHVFEFFSASNFFVEIILFAAFLFLVVIYNFAFPVILDHDKEIFDSLKESARMSNGVRWKLFGYFTAIFFGILVAVALWKFLFAKTVVGYMLEFATLSFFLVIMHMINVYVYFERKKLIQK